MDGITADRRINNNQVRDKSRQDALRVYPAYVFEILTNTLSPLIQKSVSGVNVVNMVRGQMLVDTITYGDFEKLNQVAQLVRRVPLFKSDYSISLDIITVELERLYPPGA